MSLFHCPFFLFEDLCVTDPRLSLFYFFNKFIYLFIFGCVGSSLLCMASSSCSERGLLFVVVCELLIVVASLVAEHRF